MTIISMPTVEEAIYGNRGRMEARDKRVTMLALYVSRGLRWSDQAEALVASLCDELREQANYDLRVIDVQSGPSGALANRVFVTPTLIRLAPPPKSRLVGQFTDPNVVRRFLQSSFDA